MPLGLHGVLLLPVSVQLHSVGVLDLRTLFSVSRCDLGSDARSKGWCKLSLCVGAVLNLQGMCVNNLVSGFAFFGDDCTLNDSLLVSTLGVVCSSYDLICLCDALGLQGLGRGELSLRS